MFQLWEKTIKKYGTKINIELEKPRFEEVIPLRYIIKKIK